MYSLESEYQKLLAPSNDLIQDLSKIDGDIMVLGVGGKMGPALAKLAKTAVDKAGLKKKIIGVARFSDLRLKEELNTLGIETISTDLLLDDQLSSLPEVQNVLYLAGTKFGTSTFQSYTWAMNTYVPGRVAQKFKKSRIVVFSTGNVYPMVNAESGGATELTQPEPIGEYGQSCLGRERVFQYFSSINKTPLLIYRLNYANDVSYGVLLEIAKAVFENKPIDLSMGSVNVIWQGDANEIALRCLMQCTIPPTILNVTGSESVSVRWLADQFAKRIGKSASFINESYPTALLSNASECIRLFGPAKVSLNQMMDMILQWVIQGRKVLNKPTHFSERKGKF